MATRTADDRRALGEALGLLSRHHSKWGDPERGRHELAEAIEILEAEGPSPELARTYNRRANEALLLDEYDSCIAFAENALALARDLDMPGEIVRALQARGAARSELGDDAGLDDMREAIRLGLELGLLEETIVSVGNLAYQLWFREGPAIAYETWRSMEELASARGYASHVQMARMGQLETLFDLGDWDQVLAIAEEMGTWDLPQERRSVIGVYAQMFEAWIHLRRGQLAGLTAAAETIAEGARRVAYTEYVTPALVLLAEARRADGDLRRRAGCPATSTPTLTAEVPNYRALLLPVAVRAFLAAMGKLETALALLPFQADVRTERHALSFLTAQAAIAAARGDVDVAARMFAEAAARWERYGFALEAGQTLLDLASCQRALERHAEARPPRRTAGRSRRRWACPPRRRRRTTSPGRAKDTGVARRYGGYAARSTSRLVDRHRLRDRAGDRRTGGHHRGRADRAPSCIVPPARRPTPTTIGRSPTEPPSPRSCAGDGRRRDRRSLTRSKPKRTHERPVSHLLVRIPNSMTVRARPDADAATVGTMPSGSKYYGVPITAWVEETAKDGRWGRVEIPYVWPRRDGLDPAARPRARPHVRRGARRPVTALGERLEVRPRAVRTASGDRRGRESHPRGRVLRHRSHPVLGGRFARHRSRSGSPGSSRACPRAGAAAISSRSTARTTRLRSARARAPDACA